MEDQYGRGGGCGRGTIILYIERVYMEEQYASGGRGVGYILGGVQLHFSTLF